MEPNLHIRLDVTKFKFNILFVDRLNVQLSVLLEQLISNIYNFFKCLSQRKPCKMVRKQGVENVQIKHGSERALYGGMNSAIY